VYFACVSGSKTTNTYVMKFILVLFFICIFLLGKTQPILIEAENFENKGGWFVDPQFYDQIGSVYLLAHGNGTPVKNASTHFKVGKPGRYFVYARTRNWVGDWFKDDEYAPGIFHIAINGKELNKSLGNKGKDTKQQYLNWDLTFVSPILGKRESRRLVGDIVFKQQDIEGEWKKYDDACVIGTYAIDQHFPASENSVYFPNQEFISNFKHDHFPIGYDVEFKYPEKKNPPYYIPYRCLYSKNIDNLFMAGRNISCSRIAFCSTRLQGTTGMMGEIIGLAAYLCTVNNCNPREIYQKYFDQFKTAIELGVPHIIRQKLNN
jgi:hypothetical protein